MTDGRISLDQWITEVSKSVSPANKELLALFRTDWNESQHYNPLLFPVEQSPADWKESFQWFAKIETFGRGKKKPAPGQAKTTAPAEPKPPAAPKPPDGDAHMRTVIMDEPGAPEPQPPGEFCGTGADYERTIIAEEPVEADYARTIIAEEPLPEKEGAAEKKVVRPFPKIEKPKPVPVTPLAVPDVDGDLALDDLDSLILEQKAEADDPALARTVIAEEPPTAEYSEADFMQTVVADEVADVADESEMERTVISNEPPAPEPKKETRPFPKMEAKPASSDQEHMDLALDDLDSLILEQKAEADDPALARTVIAEEPPTVDYSDSDFMQTVVGEGPVAGPDPADFEQTVVGEGPKAEAAKAKKPAAQAKTAEPGTDLDLDLDDLGTMTWKDEEK